MQAIELIEEACASGARKQKACEILGITIRTIERWQQPTGVHDKRGTVRRIPSNKLSDEERNQVISLTNSDEFCNLAPTQIVPKLADQGKYYASESTFYRHYVKPPCYNIAAQVGHASTPSRRS